MFDTVIVANRGEIAVRIIRTLRGLGIRSVAVYSDADAGARHVTAADVAYRLGPAPAAQSYLDIERVLRAAIATGAQALHPGYGFLAENTALATACADAGIVFVGPPPAAIEAMGDKIRAKATVAARGVRVVPGIDGVGISDDELAERAMQVGFPMLIKPSAGGGGKGMHLVTDPTQLPAEIASAKREALGAFGDDTLLIERFIERPRHIEVQVLADAHGNVVHIGERECSLQRRHQKVIEEAPSPFLSQIDRDAIGAQAVDAARACGYVNAGTVEFIVSGDRPDEAFFMEMNTRLQVEHPVTELVWGLDLVELQLRIADGEQLPFQQSDLQMAGHAFEARVYAEDPAHGFLPTGGTVLALHEPSDLPNVRVDSSLDVGSEVGATYDPMLSKVIAWGPDRESARRTLDAALAGTTVLGLTTNINFLRTILADPQVIAGQLDTSLVERIAADLPVAVVPFAAEVAAAAVALHDGARRDGDPWSDRRGWRIGESARSVWRAVGSDGHPHTVGMRAIEGNAQAFMADNGGDPVHVEVEVHPSRVRLVVDGLTSTFDWVRAAGTTWLGIDGATFGFTDRAVVAPGAAQSRTGGAAITSPMPGTVVGVAVTAGQIVAAGQAVIVVEAMKMEHTLRASVAATVAELLVQVGDRVALNQVLAVLEPTVAQED